MLTLLVLGGCSKSPAVPVEILGTSTLQIDSGEPIKASFDAERGSVVRITAVQSGIDIRLDADFGGGLVQSVDSPLLRNGTEYLTARVPASGAVSVTVSSVDEDYAAGSVDLSVHRIPEGTSADTRLIDAELRLTAAALLGEENTDWALRASVYEELGDEYQRLGLGSRAADSIMRAAWVRYLHLFEWRASSELAAEASRILRADGNDHRSAIALDLQGAALIELINEPDDDTTIESIETETTVLFQDAQVVLRDAGDIYNLARVTNNLGLMYFYLGKYDRSRAHWETARSLFASLFETKWEVIALQNLLLQDFELRRNVANAPAKYEQLLQLIDREKDPDLYVDILNNAALANTLLGNLSTALAQFDEALGMWSDHPGRGRIYAWAALAFLRGGDHEQARLLLETAIPLHEEANDLRDLAASNRLLGNIYRRTGEYDQAIKAHQRSLAARKSHYRRSNLRLELARDYVAAERFDEARQQIAEIEKSHESTSAPRIHTGLQLLKARLALEDGNSAKASEFARDAITVANEFGLWDRLYDGYVTLADAWEAQHRTDEMRAALADAVDVLEDTRLKIGSPELRAMLVAERGNAYDRLIASHFEDFARSGRKDKDDLELAIRTLARSRNLVFREQQGQTENARPGSGLASAMARHERLVYEYERDRTEKSEVDASKELVAMLVAGATAEPSRTISATSASLDLANIQRGLDASEVLLSYWTSDVGSRLIVIRSDSVEALELPEEDVIRDVAQRLHSVLRTPDSSIEDVRRAVTPAQELLLPAQVFRSGDLVVYVQPDGPLHSLPFHLLVDEIPAVVKVASLTPRADTLIAAGGGNGSLIVAYGGPATSIDGRDGVVRGADAFRASLPYVAVEAATIVKALAGEPANVLADRDATRGNLMHHAGKRLSLLHIAAHALANPTTPALSWIQLSDGRLLSADIERSRLHADVVVLSACETALGKEVAREGVFGLTRSFLVSGSSNVIASLWQVPDRATATLFAEFYEGFHRRNFDVARSLREARVATAAQLQRWQHPYFWAGFEVWRPYPGTNH